MQERRIHQLFEVSVLLKGAHAAIECAGARAREKPVLCFAHVANQMGTVEGDFEKGEANGAVAALRLIEVVAEAWRRRP